MANDGMTPADAIAEIQRRGGRIDVLDDGAIRVSPRSVLDDRLRAIIKANKGIIATLVKGPGNV